MQIPFNDTISGYEIPSLERRILFNDDCISDSSIIDKFIRPKLIPSDLSSTLLDYEYENKLYKLSLITEVNPSHRKLFSVILSGEFVLDGSVNLYCPVSQGFIETQFSVSFNLNSKLEVCSLNAKCVELLMRCDYIDDRVPNVTSGSCTKLDKYDLNSLYRKYSSSEKLFFKRYSKLSLDLESMLFV